MFDFFAPQVTIYSWVAIGMTMLLAFDFLMMLFGLSFGQLLEGLDVNVEMPGLSSLGLPKVPLALLIYFGLFGFSLVPLLVASLWFEEFGTYLHQVIMLVIGVISLWFGMKNPLTKWISTLENEEPVFNLEEALIGSQVEIVLASTCKGSPTEACFNSTNGTHYIMVEPIGELSIKYKQSEVSGLKAIGKTISNQDNLCTDQPLFIVEEKEFIYGMAEDYSEDYHWINQADVCAIATDKQSHTLDKLNERRFSDGELGDWRKVYYKAVWVFVTACFTRNGCKAYINSNRHNHQGELRIYAQGSFRNEEYQTVRNALIALNKGSD